MKKRFISIKDVLGQIEQKNFTVNTESQETNDFHLTYQDR